MCSSEDEVQKLFNYTYGFLVSKTMFTACELGVFDLLHEAQEPISAVKIASRLGTSVDGIRQLLDACVGLKLLKVDLQSNEGYYSNTDASTEYLVKSSPRTLHHMMMYYSNTIYMCCHFLPQAVREGKHQYENTFGISSREIFDSIYRSEEEILSFIRFMDSIWNICGKDVIQAFDLSAFHTVYDLGGCSGGLAKQFVSTYKDSTVTIMDLPKVVQTAEKHFVTDKEQQIHFLEGDFFDDPIPEADLFILSRIIHDWADEKCIGLLRKIYQSCRSGGGVLIVEVLLNEDRSGPVISQMFSLNLLVMAEGKERTPSEYTKLLTDSGFRDIEVKATGNIYNAILGRK
ncbi:acetylserotonin O-methyltransferase-like [Hyla sarda]|uniref:acetylserotonin O-methyltransferase-like n=1 Tax=Hyla sarda TaxID=327740 RepID=UPI0024C27A75|nr:acetylserotonin O-methyltransferase-like [Hyla sarda]